MNQEHQAQMATEGKPVSKGYLVKRGLLDLRDQLDQPDHQDRLETLDHLVHLEAPANEERRAPLDQPDQPVPEAMTVDQGVMDNPDLLDQLVKPARVDPQALLAPVDLKDQQEMQDSLVHLVQEEKSAHQDQLDHKDHLVVLDQRDQRDLEDKGEKMEHREHEVIHNVQLLLARAQYYDIRFDRNRA